MDNMSIGAKIKQLRTIRKVSQEDLGLAVGYERTTISLYESGDSICPEVIQRRIKEFLNAEGIPFNEKEREGFKDRLYIWNSLINERLFDEAKEMQKQLSVITLLPQDVELNVLYNLFRCRLLFGEGNVQAVTEILENIDVALVDANDEIMHHYYYVRGTFSLRQSRTKDAAGYYQKAYKLMKGGLAENKALCFNVALCESRLGRVVNAMILLEDIRGLYSDTDILGFLSENLYALNCIRVGQLHRAKKVLEKCHTRAVAIKDKAAMGAVLVNYGCLYQKSKDLHTAIDYLNQAFDCFPEENFNYVDVLYRKVQCLFELKDYPRCIDLLLKGKKLSRGNEVYSICFQALEHLMTLENSKSIDYLEKTAIPYLLKTSENFNALYYCESLRAYYEKKGRQTKALQMSQIISTIYLDILEGGAIE